MKKIVLLQAVILFSFTAFIGSASAIDNEHAGHGGAQPEAMGGKPAGGMHEMMMAHMREMQGSDKRKSYADVVLQHADELKLSDEQIGKITRIHLDNQRKIELIDKRIRETMKAAHETFLTPSSDEASIRQAAKEHDAAFDELVETALKSRNAINALLTPEQLNTLQSAKGGH